MRPASRHAWTAASKLPLSIALLSRCSRLSGGGAAFGVGGGLSAAFASCSSCAIASCEKTAAGSSSSPGSGGMPADAAVMDASGIFGGSGTSSARPRYFSSSSRCSAEQSTCMSDHSAASRSVAAAAALLAQNVESSRDSSAACHESSLLGPFTLICRPLAAVDLPLVLRPNRPSYR